jgi:uncharacterized protein (TIGR02271 family)
MERFLDWDDIKKKQALGNDNIDLGEVKEVGKRYIMTQKGSLIRDTFYFPKYMVKDYNGQIVWFNVSEDQLENYRNEQPPVREDYAKYRTENMPAGVEAVIPVVEERLKVSKTTVTEETIIVKEPITEYKLIEVPIVREELKIVRRPVSTGTMPAKIEADDLEKGGEIRVLLSREEVQVTKKSYVFEEVIIRKEKVTDKKTISETVTKERVDTEAMAE